MAATLVVPGGFGDEFRLADHSGGESPTAFRSDANSHLGNGVLYKVLDRACACSARTQSSLVLPKVEVFRYHGLP